MDDYEIISGRFLSIFWIALKKINEVYIYSFLSGQEAEIMNKIIEHVHNEELELDWFDAAGLGTKVTQIAIKNL